MTSINFSTLFTKPIIGAASFQQVGFKGSEIQAFQNELEFGHDNFTSNPMQATFKSKEEIEQLAKANPRIMALLRENNLPLKVNIEALEDMR